ncbi:MAG: HNH endonuclease [Gammaproteobacteria bacterium]|nr:HNH endonuclease [Gammaproteobacteria bacterium]
MGKRDRLAKAFVRAYRIEAYTRQEGRCIYCGAFLSAKTATAEHIVPTSRGGSDRADNIAAACADCNSVRGNHSVADFLKRLRKPESCAPARLWICHFNRRINKAVQRCEAFIEQARIRGIGR